MCKFVELGAAIELTDREILVLEKEVSADDFGQGRLYNLTTTGVLLRRLLTCSAQ